MFCKNCGAKLEDNSKFCASCGSEVAVEAQTEVNTSIEEQATVTPSNDDAPKSIENPTPKKFSGKGIAGFVLSLVGMIIFGIPCGILGIIFSSIALKEVKTKNLKGKGLAIAGLVISIIDVVLTIAML